MLHKENEELIKKYLLSLKNDIVKIDSTLTP